MPKFSSIAAASSPSGSPPPSGDMFFQNSECSTWPERWNARFFSSWLIVAEVARLAGLAELLEVVLAPVDVGLVVLVVVQLEDLGRVVRLERGVVVGQVGQFVLRHGSSSSGRPQGAV